MASSESSKPITLHGPSSSVDDEKPGSGSAIVLKLSNSIVADLKRATDKGQDLRFTAGASPVREVVQFVESD